MFMYTVCTHSIYMCVKAALFLFLTKLCFSYCNMTTISWQFSYNWYRYIATHVKFGTLLLLSKWSELIFVCFFLPHSQNCTINCACLY